MTDAQPLAVSLPDARRRLMRAANTSGPELDPELEDIRRRGLEEIMAAQWSRTAWSRFAGATWDKVPPANLDQLRSWSEASKPGNLVVVGPVGVGKTSAASVALRKAHESCLEVRFITAVDMMYSLRPGGPEGLMDELCEVDRLLIDDIGKEVPSARTAEQLDYVISARYNEERPLVITSNFNLKDLETHLGSHAASRLLGDGATVVIMRGEDRRRFVT